MKNAIIAFWWRLLRFTRDESLIPSGQYCYSPDDYKNEQNTDLGVYYIIPCEYFKYIGRGYYGCSYLGIVTDDSVFADQCKMCNENY
jgi:hypothetical protein